MRDERIDELNAKRLSTLEPETKAKAEKHISACAAKGVKLLVTQARRSMAEQAALYAVGRTMPGRVVTNARAGSSWHNFGRAYDVAVVEGGDIVWSGAGYAQAGKAGAALGLVWGGGFRSVRGDIGHFEYHPGLTLSDMAGDESEDIERG